MDSQKTPITSIHQLAKHLGVSIGTVSRALNNRPGVNAETRKRVLAAADQLGYVPDQAGRSLRRGSTSTIGVVLETGVGSQAVGSPFFAGLTDGMQKILRPAGLDLVLLPHSAEEDPYDYLQRIVAQRIVDVIIITATTRTDHRIGFLRRKNIPFVALGRSETGKDSPWVDIAFEAAVASAMDRLAAKGHKRIAIAVPIGEVNYGYICRETYKERVRALGLDDDPTLIVPVDQTPEGGIQFASTICRLADRPTAAIPHSSSAAAFYWGLSQNGLKPGEDVAIIGLIETPLARSTLVPELASFDLSRKGLGAALAEAVLAQIPQLAKDHPAEWGCKPWPLKFSDGASY